MKITLKEKTYIQGLSPELKNKIKKALTITNPMFHKQVDLGLFTKAPSSFIYYKQLPDNIFSVPIGYTAELLELLDLHKCNYTLIDERHSKNLAINFSTKMKLRDYQKEAVDILKTKTVGVLQAPTGSGKTVIIIKLLEELKQNTLILVDTVELANQMIDRISEFSNLSKEDIGLYGNGRKEIKSITVALLQSMYRVSENDIPIFNAHFGAMICDETHILPASTFYEVFGKINTKYKFGVSATPKREDGLTKVIFFATGPIVHKIPFKKVEDKLEIPDITVVETDYFFPLLNTKDYVFMINDLTEDEDRNELILKEVDKYKGIPKIILSERVSQIMFLNEKLNESGNHKSRYLVSRLPNNEKPGKFKTMPKKERQEIIDKIKTGEIDTIVSSYGIFQKGLDIPSLKVLFLATPVASEIVVKQSAGRLMRKSSNTDTPIIVDFFDKNVDLLKAQFYKRSRIFKNLTK